MTSSDAELLVEFGRSRSDAAFGEIVRRYRDLVYGCARRQMRDPGMAEDVTQAAFLVLAKKASSINPKHLTAWLITTTRLCALDAVKKQTRRTHYEREAAMIRPELQTPGETADPNIAACLDEVMSRLAARESSALGMRFLQNKSVNDIAAAMGVSPNAAQKILSRSLGKLRNILTRRGVAAPSVAVLTAVMLHESAKAAPAGLAISSSSASTASVSIAKGVLQMMLWAKVKIGIAITATTTLLAGTGSILLVEAMGQTSTPPANLNSGAVAAADVAPADAPSAGIAPAPASVAPFSSPFLELVGCRVKESVLLKLSADAAGPQKVTWTEQQYPLVQWTIDPVLAAKVNDYAIEIVPTNDPAGAKTIHADKSTSSQALVEELGQPGEYEVKISAMGADSRAVGSASAHVVVNPLPMTQIMISDIQADGTNGFTCVMQQMNLSPQALSDYRFMNSDFVHVEKITDDEGLPLRFTASHVSNTFQYRCHLKKPIQPGEAQLLSNSGMENGLVRNLGGGLFLYTFTHTPHTNFDVRRVELYRLPAGAKLIYSSPNLVSKVVDGKTQIFMDVMIPPNGSNSVAFRYRLGN